ncbi:hypothetical protein Bca4012_069988 [Brassica carinata]|nr:PREDICTED: uncharacterized protein LOC106294761 [Brassica oleracea var. oleracea]
MGNNSSSNTNLSNPKNRLLEEHHHHDKLKTHSPTSRVSFLRSPLPWLFMFLFFLPLILISTTGGGGRKTCSPTYPHLSIKDQTNSSSVLKDPEEHEEEEEDDDVPPRVPSLYPRRPRMFNTTLDHVVFGIAASSVLWETRKEYIKSWWRPGKTRGVVWIDKRVRTYRNEPLPQIRISQDTSRFRYTHPVGDRSAVRISRVVTETLRLGLKGVRWFVMGDDDTVFVVDNVVNVLSKYDHTQFYYVGSSSEAHVQNIFFSYSMAFGGGGFAISYALAVELSKMQDRCIQRYPGLYGSDDRIQACMTELGVPLTKEPGFHQYDVYGDLLGLLGAHPVAPLVTLHHIDVVQPIFPKMKRSRALRHLMSSAELDSASIFQQSICYDQSRFWSISVSWGFSVQIIRGIISPRELEMPSRTFLNWFRRADYIGYAFNTRPVSRHPCQRPFVFYVNSAKYDEGRRQVIGYYNLDKTRRFPGCRWRLDSPGKIDSVVVLKRPDPLRWHKSPRRDCCRVLPSRRNTTMYIWVGNCGDGEISELEHPKQ